MPAAPRREDRERREPQVRRVNPDRNLRDPRVGVIDRNTIGSAVGDSPGGSVTLPANTGTPPFGVGSLGLQTSNDGTTSADPAEKIAFGNQVDFAG